MGHGGAPAIPQADPDGVVAPCVGADQELALYLPGHAAVVSDASAVHPMSCLMAEG